MTTTVLPRVNYLNVRHGVASWLLTKDHKRIGIMYLVVVTIAFFLGGLFAAGVRIELTTPQGDFVSADTYNRLFTMHGVLMVFFVLVPVGAGDPRQLRAAADDRREGRRVPEDQPPELVRLRHRVHLHA